MYYFERISCIQGILYTYNCFSLMWIQAGLIYMADSYYCGVSILLGLYCMVKHISLQILISDAGHLESTCCGVPGSWKLGIKCTFTTVASSLAWFPARCTNIFLVYHLVFAQIVQLWLFSAARESCTVTCDWGQKSKYCLLFFSGLKLVKSLLHPPL